MGNFIVTGHMVSGWHQTDTQCSGFWGCQISDFQVRWVQPVLSYIFHAPFPLVGAMVLSGTSFDSGLPWAWYEGSSISLRFLHMASIWEGGWHSRYHCHSAFGVYKHKAPRPSLEHLLYWTLTLSSQDCVPCQTVSSTGTDTGTCASLYSEHFASGLCGHHLFLPHSCPVRHETHQAQLCMSRLRCREIQ